MSIVAEGIYKQAGQPDVIVPFSVDADGRLNTTATATVSSEVEIARDLLSRSLTEQVALSRGSLQHGMRGAAVPMLATQRVLTWNLYSRR